MHDVAVELFYDGAWHDLVANDDVLADTAIVITRGQGDEGAAPRPCTITCRLNNDDDMFRTSNPESPLYGKVGVNTPLRVSMGGNVRGEVAVSSWKAGQTSDFRRKPKRGKAWTDIEGGGATQRVNQWTEPLESAFTQYNRTQDHVVGYWPLEDAKGTKFAYTPTPGALRPEVKNLAFESQYRPRGSAPLADINNGPVSTRGLFAPGPAGSTTGWQVSWVQKLTTFDATQTYPLFFWTTANGNVWDLVYTNGNMLLQGTNDNGSISVGAIQATGYNFGAAGWVLFVVEAAYSAGTTTVSINWFGEDDTSIPFYTTTYSGVPSSL